jgi:hypothetical protein
MADLAEIVRTFSPDYCTRYSDRMLPSHLRALNDIGACRTEVFGGHLGQCDQCGYQHYSYHSCRNRSCPTCHAGDRRRWLDKRQAQLLPIPYYHVVFTLPEELRHIVRRHQKALYAALFQAAAEALQTLCADERYVGGDIGILAVLHTWTRQLIFHPHVHFLVTGGGLTKNGEWLAARKKYLVPVTALSQIFRAKFMALARTACPEERFPESIWEKDWVTYCKPAVQGRKRLLDYLGRYVHSIAISNRRILRVNKGQVVFEYKDSRDDRWKTTILTGEEFLRRFLQHVLPRGFHKVRYYGLFSPRNKSRLSQAQWGLSLQEEKRQTKTDAPSDEPDNNLQPKVCPKCVGGIMLIVSWIPRATRGPP